MPQNEDAGRDILGMHRALEQQFCDLANVVPGLASAGSFRELLDENLSGSRDQGFFSFEEGCFIGCTGNLCPRE